MSCQLKTIDSSKDWIELTDSQIDEYNRVCGLFLKPSQVIKLDLSYNMSSHVMWHMYSGEENEA